MLINLLMIHSLGTCIKHLHHLKWLKCVFYLQFLIIKAKLYKQLTPCFRQLNWDHLLHCWKSDLFSSSALQDVLLTVWYSQSSFSHTKCFGWCFCKQKSCKMRPAHVSILMHVHQSQPTPSLLLCSRLERSVLVYTAESSRCAFAL